MQKPESQAIFGPRPSPRDRGEIIDIICAFVMFADLLDFQSMRALLAPDAMIDGRETGQGFMAATAFIDSIQDIFPGFDATQHRVTNFQVAVTDDEATCLSHVYATHMLGAERWLVGAMYTHHLKRIGGAWRISLMQAKILFQHGNLKLMELAAARCAK